MFGWFKRKPAPAAPPPVDWPAPQVPTVTIQAVPEGARVFVDLPDLGGVSAEQADALAADLAWVAVAYGQDDRTLGTLQAAIGRAGGDTGQTRFTDLVLAKAHRMALHRDGRALKDRVVVPADEVLKEASS